MFAATPAITTAGPHRGCPAGPTPRCCPISGARRAGRAAPAPIAAATARSPSARRVTATRWSRPASLPGGAATPGDARLQRRAAGGPRAHPADDPPRSPVQRRRGLSAPGACAGPISRSRPARSPTRIVLEGGRAVGVEYARRGVDRNRPGRARGDPLRRRHQFAAAIDAVGHRRPRLRSRRTASRSRSTLPGVGKNLQDHLSVLADYARREAGAVCRDVAARPRGRWRSRAPIALAPARRARRRAAGPALSRAAPMSHCPTSSSCSAPRRPAPAPYLPPFKPAFADGFALRAVMLRPESRGEITLASADPQRAAAHPPEFPRHRRRPAHAPRRAQAGAPALCRAAAQAILSRAN